MKKNEKDHLLEVTHPDENFKGYTIEELQHQRALLALRKELSKTRLLESIHELNPSYSRNKKEGHSSSKFAIAGKIASKIFSNLNLLDYAMIGFSMFGTMRKGYKMIKGKKK